MRIYFTAIASMSGRGFSVESGFPVGAVFSVGAGFRVGAGFSASLFGGRDRDHWCQLEIKSRQGLKPLSNS
ncbi:MAG: hypothetical protein ACRCT1_14820 [Microcoleaceae cyanobacterium]